MEGLIYILALLAVSVISMFLAGVSWKKNDVQGARWLAALLGSVALWAAMQVASALSVSLGDKLFYHSLMYIGISLIPVSVFLFVLDYYHLLKSLHRTLLGALFIIPFMTVCLIVTDSYHHLFYRSVRLQEFGDFFLINGSFNMWFWVHSVYSYLLILGTLLVLGYQLRNESGPYRRQSLQLMGAILASSAINLLTITQVIQVQIDLTPFTFVLVGAIFYYSLFHTGVFEFGPITKSLLYDNTHDGLLIVDAAGTITEYNRAFLDLFEAAPDRIIGRNAADLLNAEGFPVEKVLGALNVSSSLHTRASHESRTWQITRTRLRDKGAPTSATLYLFKDVTEISRSLEAANGALEAAERARESITRNLSDMSHEIRTPLMGILGAAHQLRADADDAEQASDADQILAGAEALLGTVNRILDYSKLEAGKMHSLQETFSLDSYFSHIETLPHPVFQWDSPAPSRALALKGDSHHLWHLIQLLHGFLQDSGTDGISLTVTYEDSRLRHRLRFQTPAAEAQELLMHWEDLSEYLTKPWHPEPLKLILAQRLAHFIGAPLSLHARDNHWLLDFAAAAEAADPLPFGDTQLFTGDSAEPCRLLFAEDSIINQAVIRRMFKTMPWEIVFASDGLQALEIAKTSVFDGIFTDIHMPGLGGVELSYSLLETPNCDTPIFALTSDTNAELQELVSRSPIRALVVKPCPKDRLIRLLREYPRIVHTETE